MNLGRPVRSLIISGLCLGVVLLPELRGVAAPPTLMRDFIGINGHTLQFKPDLYRPVCGLVRDYHPVEWDLGGNSAVLPSFPQAKNGVDWSRVYGSWRASGWNIDVSLMFESVARTNWKNMEADARAYGQAFAAEFGPSGNRRLVDSVEIGNEPGKWNDADYTRLFKSMAQGLRAGDPKLKIATCNLTTGKSGDYEKSIACAQASPELFDVLNIHTYAQLEGWPTWRRSFPEDPKLPHYLQDVEALCQWRDGHTPGKPIWITEFGYDSSTQPAETNGDFAKWVGVTDTQQAQWLVRSLLVFSAMPVERAYIYFFDDNDQPRVHASAGVTRHFKPKPSFYAVEQCQRLLGDCHFKKIIANQPGQLRAQEYRNDSGKVVWVIWSPTGDSRTFATTLDNPPGKLLDAQHMCVSAIPSPPPAVTQVDPARITLPVDESPLYVVFERP
jgi:serine/threonine-protein kinase ATR